MTIAATQSPAAQLLPTRRTELLPHEAERFGMPGRQDLLPTDLSPYAKAPRTELKAGEATGQAVLNASLEPAAKTDEQIHQELTRGAQRLVSQTFFGTLLKQMHDSPFKSEVFSGGRGGEAFSSMYDQHLADRMARASGRKLADSIVRHLERSRKRAGARDSGGTSVPRTPAAAAAR